MIKNINTIQHGNCCEVLPQFDAGCVDFILTSPPYDNLRNYGGYNLNFEFLAGELYRVLRNGGVMVWVIADATVQGSETGTSFRQALYFKEKGFSLHDTMIFKKKNPVPQIYRKRYMNEFEYMFVFSKGTVTTHNALMTPCIHAGLELGSTTYKNYSKNTQIRTKLANPVKSEKIRGNIWEYVVGKNKEDQEAKGHPAPFPCQLARDHILSWTNENDIVLDPMCGSGTTCKVAFELKRRFLGIEIHKEYCKLARQRIFGASQQIKALAARSSLLEAIS